MKIQILKCHGSGNDFILVDEMAGSNARIPDAYRGALAKALCDRSDGIGADGVLYYLPSEAADCRMRMFNPDGGEAEMCGNGLRCIGRYCAERSGKGLVLVETMKAALAVEREGPIMAGTAFEGIETYKAEIGPVSLLPQSLPMRTEWDRFIDRRLPELSDHLTFTALSIPNPHLVTIVEGIDEQRVEDCGRAANASATFPNGVNVSFVKPLGANRIYVVTYERGVGITDSCGTAMSASAYVSVLHGITNREDPVLVFNNGGIVVCDLSRGDERIGLIGNATFVFEATVVVASDYTSVIECDKAAERYAEIDAYRNSQAHARALIRGCH